MSKSIFQSLGADTSVELNIKTNVRQLADLFDQNNKFKQEFLPGGSDPKDEAPQVDLHPLTSRVEALETAKDNIVAKLDELEQSGGGSVDLSPLNSRVEKLETNNEDFSSRMASAESTLLGMADNYHLLTSLRSLAATDHNRLNATNKFLLSIFDRDFELGNPDDSYNFTAERAPREWNEFFQSPSGFFQKQMIPLRQDIEKLKALEKVREQVEDLRNAIFELQYKTMSFQYDVVGFSYEVTTQAASNGNFATLFLPFAVTLPEGMKVYSVERSEKLTSATFKPLDITVLPPNTPVLISTPTAGSYELTSTSWTEPLNTGLNGYMAPLKPYGRLRDKTTGISVYSFILVVENGVAKFVENKNRQSFSANSAALWLSSGATVTMPTP